MRRERIAVVAATAMLTPPATTCRVEAAPKPEPEPPVEPVLRPPPRKVHAETKELRMIRMIVNDDDTFEYRV